MNRLDIETPELRTAFDPGETIDLSVSWELEQPPESVELRVVWNTAGKGSVDVNVAQTVPFESPAPAETRRTTLTLPGSPYSFSGKLVSLIWALELVALPNEDSAREVITIAPGGEEVRLPILDDISV